MCGKQERSDMCLKLVGSPCQNNQVMAHSGCWCSCACSLIGLSMQQLPGESREMAVTVEDGGACDRQGAPRDQGAHTDLDK